MYINKIFISILLFFICISFLKAKDTLLEAIQKNKSYSKFYDLIKIAGYEELFSDNYKFKKIIYIPDDKAFDEIPNKLKKIIWNNKNNDLAKKIVKTHLYSDSIKNVFMDPKKKVSVIERFELGGELVRVYSNSDLFVKDMVEEGVVVDKEKYTIIPVGCVMFIQPSYEDSRLSQIEKEKSLITSCCLLTDQEVLTITKDYNF